MIAVGKPVADATVWLGPREPVQLSDIWQQGELTLLLFYLFDWSST